MAGAAKAPDRVPETRVRKLREGSPKIWKIGYTEGGEEIPFVQDGLSFFEKSEFLTLISDALDEALDRGLSINDIMSTVGGQSDLKSLIDPESDARGAMMDILPRVFTKLFSAAPRLLEDTYLLALGVEPEARSRVRPFLRKIDDATGFEILDVFIQQNAKTLADFLKRWAETVQNAMTMISQNESDEPNAA